MMLHKRERYRYRVYRLSVFLGNHCVREPLKSGIEVFHEGEARICCDSSIFIYISSTLRYCCMKSKKVVEHAAAWCRRTFLNWRGRFFVDKRGSLSKWISLTWCEKRLIRLFIKQKDAVLRFDCRRIVCSTSFRAFTTCPSSWDIVVCFGSCSNIVKGDAAHHS